MAHEHMRHRAFFLERMRQGLPIQAAIEQLAAEAPAVLADLCIGEYSIGSSEFMELAFPFVPIMEGYVPEKALYLRLLSLYPDIEGPLFELAQLRHPQKDWLIELIRKAQEPSELSVLHLLALSPSMQDFWLPLYIEQDFMAGVWALAKQGDVRPVFVLLERHRYSEAAQAAAYVLDVSPDCGLIEVVASQYGPKIGPWLKTLQAHFQNPQTAVALENIFQWYPDVLSENGDKNKDAVD